jgi:hypothetical protein
MNKMENPNTDPATIFVNNLLKRVYTRAEEIQNSNRIEETFNVSKTYFGYPNYLIRNTEPHAFSCTSYNGGLN